MSGQVIGGSAWLAVSTVRNGSPRRRQVRAPQPPRVGLDLVVGAPAEHRPGVVGRIPALHRVLVALVQQQPLVLAGLSDADAPAELVDRLARLTADRPFASAHEVMVALGINEPERRAR